MKQIRSMSLEQLIRVRADIDAAIHLHVATEQRALLEMLKGVVFRGTGKLTTKRPHPLRGKKLPPKYRNPEDRTQSWAGRGKKPRWLSAALKAGKKLERFAVA